MKVRKICDKGFDVRSEFYANDPGSCNAAFGSLLFSSIVIWVRL